jgi:hypothetical protein
MLAHFSNLASDPPKSVRIWSNDYKVLEPMYLENGNQHLSSKSHETKMELP